MRKLFMPTMVCDNVASIKNIIKRLKLPSKYSHKGQNGKLLIIGGSRWYHGAPMLAILAARRFVDLVYFYPGLFCGNGKISEGLFRLCVGTKNKGIQESNPLTRC